MAQKSMKTILKPPKKRYIVNGEFKCHSEVSPVDDRDYQTQNACSALLELAEICTSSAARENSSINFDSDEQVKDTKTYVSCGAIKNKYSITCSESSANSAPGSLPCPVLCSLQKQEGNVQNLSFTSGSSNSSDNFHNRTRNIQQEQPLDLCKNKGKTITTSHQQLIDHFVDKFLCDTPASQSNYYKSAIIDPAFCKMLSEKSASDCSTSKDGKTNHTAFTLSVAIESAVDKAYSKDFSKSCNSNVPESSAIVEHITKDDCKFNVQMETDISVLGKSLVCDDEKASKSNEAKIESTQSFDSKNLKNCTDSAPSGSINKLSSNQVSKSESRMCSEVTENSSSKFFCKLVSPPKKSRVWCNIFMNEQLKNNVESNSGVACGVVSNLASPARRSSQRTCKGRRYQALITEGLLQSSKERKTSNNRKSVPSSEKVKSKSNSVTENNVFPFSKKKKKKEYTDKNKSKRSEIQESGESLFNLEEKIASLPKCSFEHLDKKKKIMLESSANTIKQQKTNASAAAASTEISCTSSYATEWTPVSSSGRYKTGYFCSAKICDQETI
ncbi:uncharacterized protein LOC118185644 [Stegodyphus dumicola]|uniref:uncharacterized protein LOC118185644 n=1 Tax=Stegodyphus dumicola TaxID=202533 RepID=UPI0015AEDB3C|nr:uncharacterized protein LOC118185644 [Stegodyphus dumicola]